MNRCIYFSLPIFLLLCRCSKESLKPGPEEEFEELKVMTYNVLFNTSDDMTLEVLRQSGADIIGVQEASSSRVAALAGELDYSHHSFPESAANRGSDDTGIISRFPISKIFQNGVVVTVNPGLEIAVFSVHLLPYPYEPYDIRDGVITAAEQAVASASRNRLPGIESLLQEIEQASSGGYPVFLMGDFNEPSFHDWTIGTAAAHMHFGKVIEWPVSKKIAETGLIDVYRVKYTDPASFPGYTWTTVQAPDEVYDRIDIIYTSTTSRMKLTDIRTVGGPGDAAGITIDHYPSDHYAVIGTWSLTP